jgi:hypothetical protein
LEVCKKGKIANDIPARADHESCIEIICRFGIHTWKARVLAQNASQEDISAKWLPVVTKKNILTNVSCSWHWQAWTWVFAVFHFAWLSKLPWLINWRWLVYVCKRTSWQGTNVWLFWYICCIPGWLFSFIYIWIVHDCTSIMLDFVCFLMYIWYKGHFESLLWCMWLVVILLTNLYFFRYSHRVAKRGS